MDDVVENFTPHWHAELDTMFGTNYAVHESAQPSGPPVATSLHVWLDEDNYKTYFPMAQSFEFLLRPLRNPDFWANLRAIPGAPNAIKRLQGLGHGVYMASKAEYYSWEPKLSRCIFKLFPSIDEEHCISIPKKQLLSCDVLIDDNPDHLVGGDYIGLLWDMPRNRWFEPGPKDMILRVKNWKDIELIIRLMSSYGVGRRSSLTEESMLNVTLFLAEATSLLSETNQEETE